jgi:serine protease Do
MKRRDILYIIVGFVVGTVVLGMYGLIKSQSLSNNKQSDLLIRLNNEISNQRSNAIVLAAQNVSPAVVSISVIQTKVVTTSPFFSPFRDDYFREFFKDFFPEYYYKKQIESLGTGVIISADGYILTNEHVISHATDINITLPDSRQFKGIVIATDYLRDRALLKIEATSLPFVELGDSDDVMIGEWVIALGNPFGFLLEDTRPSVTVGVVSALHRSIKSTVEDRIYKNMIQTDAAINPGNSGGPLVNILGQVIGINTSIFTAGGGSEGIGFAQPINEVKKFIAEVREYGSIRQPWIGIWVQDISSEINEAMETERIGVQVQNVDKGSSAEKAGIKEGDRIITVNDKMVTGVSDWDAVVSTTYVDDVLNITLLRKGDTVTTNLVVMELKESDISGGEKVPYGIYVANITPPLAAKYHLAYTGGVVVIKLDKQSIGERMGILPGDVILKVGDTRIVSKADLQRVLQSVRRLHFIIDRGGIIIQLYIDV